MILAVDGYEANAPGRVGVGRYAFELIRQFAGMQQTGSTAFDMMRVYVPGTTGAGMPPAGRGFLYRPVPFTRLWTFTGLPAAIALDRPQADVIFSPTHYVPRFVRIPKVMAIMDVSYLKFPELFRKEDLVKLTRWTGYSVRHAEHIVTISEFSKSAIIDAYRVPAERITVAYPALSEDVTRPSMSASAPSVPKRYILSVGTLQPRKNFTRLIEAMSLIGDRDIHLVIAGKKGWLYEEILNAPDTYGVRDRVTFLEYVPDNELPDLYRNAECFVLPSLYEGFGLPVLEAMAHGTPVVVSRSSSLPEIAGDAGIYVDPDHADSIAGGIDAALGESAKDRAARIKRGIARAKTFTWKKAATTVMDVLRGVVKKEAA